MILELSPVLVVCPHTDDEFGCAGTISKLIEAGIDVHYVALSRCEASVPPGLPMDVLEVECKRSTAALGIPSDQVAIHGFPVRRFPVHRQEILELLIQIRGRLNPRTVLMPAISDCHQDHRATAEEVVRAFKHSNILGYELPQNLISFSADLLVTLDERHLDSKCTALAMYRSQQFRPYSAPSFIRSLATVRGMQASSSFAEAFEVVRITV
jgi:LmbE family N-acetylglucosaminyl deacetylase